MHALQLRLGGSAALSAAAGAAAAKDLAQRLAEGREGQAQALLRRGAVHGDVCGGGARAGHVGGRAGEHQFSWIPSHLQRNGESASV